MWRTWRQDDVGQALVEFALLLPLLCFSLIGGIDVARIYAMQLAVQNGARAGAESAVLGYNLNSAQITAHVAQEMGRTPGMTVGANVCPPVNAGETCIEPTLISGTPSYQKVRVRYIFSTIISWPLMQTKFTLDRTTQFRVFP
jgi:Flp pilus assembly protein TadG